MSLEKRLEASAFVVGTETSACWVVRLNRVTKEVGVVAQELRSERDNALQWVKENILKESYEGTSEITYDTEDLDSIAQGMCHAIQLFVNRKILGLLVEKEEKP